MPCLSSDSSWVSSTDESEAEILNARDKAQEFLETFIWGEGVSLRSPVMRENVRCLEATLRRLTEVTKKVGYRQAESLNIGHVRDLEDLLEVERRERKRLEEEKMRIGGDERDSERVDGQGVGSMRRKEGGEESGGDGKGNG